MYMQMINNNTNDIMVLQLEWYINLYVLLHANSCLHIHIKDLLYIVIVQVPMLYHYKQMAYLVRMKLRNTLMV